MKRTILFIVFFLIMSMPISKSLYTQGKGAVQIIPEPRKIEYTGVPFTITRSTIIILATGSGEEEQFTARQLNDLIKEHKGFSLKITIEGKGAPGSNFVFFGNPERSPLAKKLSTQRQLSLSARMKEEGYVLDVNKQGVAILGLSSRGLYYGCMTLNQIIKPSGKSLVVPGVKVEDYPLLKMRGVTDDISRGQVSTLENFKKIIRFLSRYKMNVYMPYLEDMFTFKKHPLIGKGRGALSDEEVKELDEYGKKYHVEIIPIFETLGHCENILIKPEYLKYAEMPGATCLNTSDEATYQLLDELLSDLCAAFSSSYFHMAADESWDVGLGASKERVQKLGLAEVHAEHYKRVYDILKKYGKRVIMYGDIILNNPTILDKIPRDIVIMDWHYWGQDHYPSVETFKKTGFPFIVSPAVWNFGQVFPNYLNTFVNIQNIAKDGYNNGGMGLVTSNWGDNGGENLRELLWYGYAWTAECGWSPTTADNLAFNKKFFPDFFGTMRSEPEIIYTILSDVSNQIHFGELWRHPFLPLQESQPPLLWRIQSFETRMPLVLKLIEEAAHYVTRNRDHLEYLAFVAREGLWFAKKIKRAEEIKKLTQLPPPAGEKEMVKRKVIEMAAEVVQELKGLKEEFRWLWLLTNREANLHLLMARYDRQIAYWEEKIDHVKNDHLWVDPIIESAWIYHPDAHPGEKNASQIAHAFFRKTFELTGNIKSALLQLLGDTHAKVYVNGTFLGEVYARPTLSLTVENERIKLFDMKPLLTAGKNTIAVEVMNYDMNHSAGVNIYSEITSNGMVQKVMTDSTWLVSSKEESNWTAKNLDDAKWSKAIVRPGWTIVRPNFATGRKSWIE